MRLSDTQKRALDKGSARRWRGCRETGVTGYTMDALGSRGLADVRIEIGGKVERPSNANRGRGRMLFRLTEAGAELAAYHYDERGRR